MRERFIMKKVILILLLCFFITAAACGDANDNAGNNQNQDIADNPVNPVSSGENDSGQNQEDSILPEERVYPDLEPKDFGGYEFRFLTRTINNPDWVEWDHRDIYAAEETGDVINDAVYRRNKKIEEKYNITISETVLETDNITSNVNRFVNAGDDIYDVVCIHLLHFGTLASRGNLVNLFNVPYIELERPWWNQGSVNDLSILKKLYVVQGDLLILDNDAMEAMIFNKDLLRDNGLESPYDIVKRGEWTFDKLHEMGAAVSKDLNGDGQMIIHDDLFGIILQGDVDMSFIVAGGDKTISKDENDLPVLTFGSERSYRITDAIARLMMDFENVINLHRYVGQFPIYDEQVKMFSENRALFSWIRMRIVERLRAMETDFGIIPKPKLDTAQQNYFTRNNAWTGAAISIPVTASDIDRTGMILEDLSAESRYTLQPAYYEVNLRGKFVRDDDSQEMLDIILNNTAYDLGAIFNFGGIAEAITLGRDNRSDYASAFERVEPRVQRDIENLIAAFEELD